MSVLLLWDEAEEFINVKPDCLKRLRAAFQHSIAMRTILAATNRLSALNDLCQNWASSPFLSGYTTRYISPMTDEEAVKLIRQVNNLEGPVRVETKLLNQIKKYTGNHPFLIQLLCDRLYQTSGSLRKITEDDLIVDDQLADFYQIDYDALSPSEQAILNEIATKTRVPVSELEHALEINLDQLRSYLDGLKQRGFVRRNHAGSMKSPISFYSPGCGAGNSKNHALRSVTGPAWRRSRLGMPIATPLVFKAETNLSSCLSPLRRPKPGLCLK